MIRAPGQARGPPRHPAALSARLSSAPTGSVRTGFGSIAGRGVDDADGSTARGLIVREGKGEAMGVRVAVASANGPRGRLPYCVPGGLRLRYAKSGQAMSGRGVRRASAGGESSGLGDFLLNFRS